MNPLRVATDTTATAHSAATTAVRGCVDFVAGEMISLEQLCLQRVALAGRLCAGYRRRPSGLAGDVDACRSRVAPTFNAVPTEQSASIVRLSAVTSR